MADIDGVTTGGETYDIVSKKTRGVYYAATDDSSTSTAFVVNVPEITELYEGLTIIIRNTKVASASGCTLNVNNLGAKRIVRSNSESNVTGHWALNSCYSFMYLPNSTGETYYWYMMMGYDSNSDTIPSAISGTKASTAAKEASCTYYVDAANSYIQVIMRYGNTKEAALTLNINGVGAKPIYINGEASSSSNYTLPAGSYLVYYDGTNYYFRTDGKITGSITGAAAGLATSAGGGRTPIFIDENGVPQACDHHVRWDWGEAYSGKTIGTTFYIQKKWGSSASDPWEYTIDELLFLIHTNISNIDIPIHLPCAAVWGTSATKQIIRGGWYQNGSNGGEASVTIYDDSANNRYVVKLDTVYVNSSSASSATMDVLIK